MVMLIADHEIDLLEILDKCPSSIEDVQTSSLLYMRMQE